MKEKEKLEFYKLAKMWLKFLKEQEVEAIHLDSVAGRMAVITQDILSEERKRWVKEVRMEKILKMDYLKWELRKDLVGKYHTTDLGKATERAKGWNACKQFIESLSLEEKEEK